MNTLYIAQGEHAVGKDPEMMISTILGSCISFCLWDPVARVGGMNHMLLPARKSDGSALSAGALDLDLLINKMMPFGAERPRLRAKLFGGSSMLKRPTDIGERNSVFARNYLANEGIFCDAENIGGTKARRLRFWPATGVVQMKLVEEAPELEPIQALPINDVELF